MPKTKDTLKIEIAEDATDQTRMITVTIFAPAKEFALADMLKQRGAVAGLDALLKQAVREAVQRYIDASEELIASLAAGQKRTNGTPRARPMLSAIETQESPSTS